MRLLFSTVCIKSFKYWKFHYFPFQTAECYDPDKGCWTSIADMNYSRSSFATVSVEDCIYALGGQSTCTVERYDTSTGRWELTPAMSTKRINFGAAEVCGFIYIVGKCLLVHYFYIFMLSHTLLLKSINRYKNTMAKVFSKSRETQYRCLLFRVVEKSNWVSNGYSILSRRTDVRLLEYK